MQHSQRTRTLLLGAAASVVTAALAAPAAAAPVMLQDFEAPDGLDAPFNLHPGYSGTSQGEATPANALATADGAQASSQSSLLSFTDDPAFTGPTAGGWSWQIRHLPNAGGSNTGTTGINPLFAADGFVGFFLKVEPTVTADIQVAPVLEGPAGTTEATAGTLKNVVKDGQWHLYQWDMDSAAEFNTPWYSVYDDLSTTLGDGDLEATNSFDSIAFVSTNGGDAAIAIDQIQYDNAGPIPEPGSLAALALGVPALLRRRRRP